MTDTSSKPQGPGPARSQLFKQFLREKGTRPQLAPRIPVVGRDRPLPLSSDQQRFWFLHQLAPAAYNDSYAIRMKGRLSLPALQQSMNELVHRHEILRMCFTLIDGRPTLEIIPRSSLSWDFTDSTSNPSLEDPVSYFARADARVPFELSKGPPLRLRLLKLNDDEHVLLLTIHHLISDGHSFGILFRELSQIYDAYSGGRLPQLAPPATQFADYASWEQDRIGDSVAASQAEYWQHVMSGFQRGGEIPTDRQRSDMQDFEGCGYDLRLDGGLIADLTDLGREQKASLFMVVLSAYQVLVHHCSGSSTFCVGIPVSRRSQPELEGTMGLFVNTIPLICDFTGNPSFRDVIRHTRDRSLRCFENQDVPFDRIVKAAGVPRDLGRNPLFQSIVVHHALPAPVGVRDLEISAVLLPYTVVRSDLALWIVDEADQVTLRLQYSRRLFDSVTIERLMTKLLGILNRVTSDNPSLDELHNVCRSVDPRNAEASTLKTGPVPRLKRVAHARRAPMGHLGTSFDVLNSSRTSDQRKEHP